MPTSRFRTIPKVDRVLDEGALVEALERLPRDIVVRTVQDEIEALRQALATQSATAPGSRDRFAPPGLNAFKSSKSSGMPSPSRSISSSTSIRIVAITPSFVAVTSAVPLD